ncbi:hypothetical protein Tco_1005363 [Tanacetum coccineum]|uniref:Uncharacterized protein n=1 Tax=Tanacetum coccineum TaxID=301880 RepID=A0ABQ5FFU6_9ASTR
MTGAKFDIEEFDGISDFRLWRVKMRALLIQHRCEAALEVLPADMEAEAKAELNKKAHSVMILCSCNKVLREVTGTQLYFMSDSEHSYITYTSVSIPVEDDSDMGSPGVDGPPSPDYPVYPEYIPPEDDVFPVEEQPLPAATSPTADSPGYIPESDPERDPKEDVEEDPEKELADYPADRRDDDDDDDEDDEEEDEEHLAPAEYTIVALQAIDHVPSEEEIESFETDECAAMILEIHTIYI